MGWSLKEDLSFGKKNERIVISYLNKHIPFESDWYVAYKNQFNKVDFSSWKVIGELKSRKVSSTTYPDTMFGENKMKYLRDKNMDGETRTFRFFFLFTDGLYYWDFDPELDQLGSQYTIRDTYHREKCKYEPYCYVKKEYLTQITDTIDSWTFENEETLKYIL